MKKALLLALALVLTLSSLALGVPANRALVFDRGPMGKVTFSGKVHSAFKCAECHNPDMFPRKKGGTSTIKMTYLHKGRLCGKCHDGKTAFRAMDNCDRCHKE